MFSLVSTVTIDDFIPIIVSLAIVILLWWFVIPRGLKGLRVAFQREENVYEIHILTRNTADARGLLQDSRVRFGIQSYLWSLTGIAILLVEFIISYSQGILELNQWVLFVAITLISIPAVISILSSLDAQLKFKLRNRRADLELKQAYKRVTKMILLGIIWIGFTLIFRLLLRDYFIIANHNRLNSATIFFAFLPAIVAYGRVLGSSWNLLVKNKMLHARGKPTEINPEEPSKKGRALSTIVLITAITMPITAINTLFSLLVTFLIPERFVHSESVFRFGDIVQQDTIMEEGGLLGFYAIEFFSRIETDAIRKPLVSAVLLFLILNIAIVGIAFVFEVARTMFLAVTHISGRAGIKLADNKLIRTERAQQADILSFCFSGFAGQSMFLLALAMMTFWDSTFLPQGAACGYLETNVCSIATKNMLEELTWMMASAGQIIFLIVWVLSIGKLRKLNAMKFDAVDLTKRTELETLKTKIRVQEVNVIDLIRKDKFTEAFNRYEEMLEKKDNQSLIAKLRSEITLSMISGNWESTETMSDKLLALEGGEDDFARLALIAANLATRDYKEAKHHLNAVAEQSQERLILNWIGTLLSPDEIKFDMENIHHIQVSSAIRGNLELLKWYGEKSPTPNISGPKTNTPISRKILLRDIALLRIEGRSEDALDMLEMWMEEYIQEDLWPAGLVAKSLLEIDCGLYFSAEETIDKAHRLEPKHPMVKAALEVIMENENISKRWNLMPNVAVDWPSIYGNIDSKEWNEKWIKTYTVQPLLSNNIDMSGVAQSILSNIWVANKPMREANIDFSKRNIKNLHKKKLIPTRNERPIGNHLILTGLVGTVSGIALDFGFTNTLNPENPALKSFLEFN
ncbi:MAG: hypothetical protein CMB64_02730 [Euryarchaeota archaeon]|nr:hypothetical protein [Euryarchaeota archaeon]